MTTEFAEKLRSLSFPRKYGSSNRVPVLDDRDGTVGGYQTTHWDDHQDAEIIPKPVKARTSEEE